MNYTDPLFGSTAGFIEAYNNQTLVPLDTENATVPELSERGVAAAGTGSLLTSLLPGVFRRCVFSSRDPDE